MGVSRRGDLGFGWEQHNLDRELLVARIALLDLPRQWTNSCTTHTSTFLCVVLEPPVPALDLERS